MVLSGIHGTYRGTGGKYDTVIDAVNHVPGAQWAGQGYLNHIGTRPRLEGVLTGYTALDIASNSGDATVMGVWDLADDAEFTMAEEMTDPVGNVFDILGGMIEEGGEITGLEGIEVAGSWIEEGGEFISDPIAQDDEWYDGFVEQVENFYQERYGGGGAQPDGGTATETPTPEPTDTTTPEPTETNTPEPTDTATPETTPEPGADYNFYDVFDSSDEAAFESFFRDAGDVESLDIYWENEDSGTGHYILQATNENGTVHEMPLQEDAVYDGQSYDIDGREMQEIVQANDEGELWDLFDESDQIENRG